MSESEPRARRGGGSVAFSKAAQREAEEGEVDGEDCCRRGFGGEEGVREAREEEEDEEEREVGV